MTNNNSCNIPSVANEIVCASTSGVGYVGIPPGTSGQVLQSSGASTPTWSTATYPTTAGTSGNILTSDGTNFNSSSTISTLNILGSTTGTAPSAGYIGEQIRSYQPTPQLLTANTALNITSINLTAGVCDISCIVEYSISGGVVTGNSTISINNVSATINSNDGDNTVKYNQTGADQFPALIIPSFRVLLSTTTPY